MTVVEKDGNQTGHARCCTALQPQKMREEFLRADNAQGCIVCYCTVQYVGATQYSTSVVAYTHSLHGGHTSVTMSVRKKAKCGKTMTVESECCDDQAKN